MGDRDHRGYYRALGPAPSATASQIAEAFRRLALELHPDRNPGPEARERFKRVTEAYHVLGNAERRAQYDNAQPDPTESAAGQLEPITCDRCSAVTAQPRYVIFRSVVSFVVATMRTPMQGVFCARCARREAFRASAVSAAAGWWGLPWGPLWTIAEILHNALGGERPKGSEQKLLWYNALAFYGRGQGALAYGLARRVQSLEDNELRGHASDLIGHLHRLGVPRDTPQLKNPWRFSLRSLTTHLGILCAPPATLVLLLALASGQMRSGPAAPSYVSAGAQGSGQAPAAALSDASMTAPQGSVQPACATPPANGQIMGGIAPASYPGHRLQIENGSAGPVIVKVRDAVTGRLAFSFFVAQGATATVSGIPDGVYRFQYAIGAAVSSDCDGLSGIQAVQQFPRAETLTTTYTDTDAQTETLSYTLYGVPDGNVQPQTISPESFNAA